MQLSPFLLLYVFDGVNKREKHERYEAVHGPRWCHLAPGQRQ